MIDAFFSVCSVWVWVAVGSVDGCGVRGYGWVWGVWGVWVGCVVGMGYVSIGGYGWAWDVWMWVDVKCMRVGCVCKWFGGMWV